MTDNRPGFQVDDAKLEEFAENEVRALRLTGSVPALKIARRAKGQLGAIKQVYQRAMKILPDFNRLPQELEWLMDNWYIAQREGLHAASELKRAGRLPAPRFGLPAIYILSRSLVRAGNGSLSAERLEAYLEAVQKVRAFEERELWLLIPMLRASLVEELFLCCPELEKSLDRISKEKQKQASCHSSPETTRTMSNIFASFRMLSGSDHSGL